MDDNPRQAVVETENDQARLVKEADRIDEKENEPSEKSSRFEPESALASEFRNGIQFVISRVFHYLRLSKITKEMKVVKDRAGMKAAHQDMMAKLEDDVVKQVSKQLEESEVIQKLNDLSVQVESEPLTFEEVWRPSGDAEADLEDHLAPIHEKMEHHLTATLAQLRTENRDKMALIKQLEDEITRQKSKMAAVVDNLKEQASRETLSYQKMREGCGGVNADER